MAIDSQEFAQMLGAEIVGEVPDVGGGPFGMARLARLMHQRLIPSQGERPGRPTNPDWVTRHKVPMSEATVGELSRMAEEMSTAERRISPMQVAAQLLEEALRRVQPQPDGHVSNAESERRNQSGTGSGVSEIPEDGAASRRSPRRAQGSRKDLASE